MFLRSLVFVLVLFAPSESLKPRTTGTSHKYKKLFITNEGQSCPDISDSRVSPKPTKFCYVDAFGTGVSTTLSLWAWDQGRTTAQFEGVIQLHTVTNDGVEHMLHEFVIDHHGNYVQWYHYDFTLNATNVTHLRLSYQITVGNSRQLNIRDVSFSFLN
jgi:hypothetical protein